MSAELFRARVLANGGQLESIALEARSIDVGWFGSPAPRRVFIHFSNDGTGSAIQLQWLDAGIDSIPEDGAVAIAHGLNSGGDSQASRRFRLYIAGRLLSAERIVAIEVRTASRRFGADRLIVSEESLYSRMCPLARVEFAVQEFGKGGWLFRERWRAETLESGKEAIEDQLARLFA